MPKKDPLHSYKAKRDFSRTSEPAGRKNSKKLKFPRFVIQKHAARRLHYDFRLEDEGVLKSWAVPKGPSLNPADRRLAVQTENHPLDYAGFEGMIPKGEYGGGNVIVWDRGYYLNLSEKNGRLVPLSEGIRKGHARFWLEGQKIKGGFSLARIGKDGERNWLLIKHTDKQAGLKKNPVLQRPESVLSGKKIEELGAGDRVWTSRR